MNNDIRIILEGQTPTKIRRSRPKLSTKMDDAREPAPEDDREDDSPTSLTSKGDRVQYLEEFSVLIFKHFKVRSPDMIATINAVVAANQMDLPSHKTIWNMVERRR